MSQSDQKEKLKRILARERKRRMLTQEEVAEAVDTSPRNYQRWERGENFPQEYYLRKLREFFGPCIDEVISFDEPDNAVNQGQVPDSQDEGKILPPHSGRNYRRLAIVAFLLLIICSAGVGYLLHVTHPYGFGPVKPGGAWISPIGPAVGDQVHFAAYAYPTHQGDPAIDHVNFTAYWPGVDPRAWEIVCQVRIPLRKDIYSCDVNLRQLGAPPGQITISFDVYDRRGNVNFAPNGEHKVIYTPIML